MPRQTKAQRSALALSEKSAQLRSTASLFLRMAAHLCVLSARKIFVLLASSRDRGGSSIPEIDSAIVKIGSRRASAIVFPCGASAAMYPSRSSTGATSGTSSSAALPTEDCSENSAGSELSIDESNGESNLLTPCPRTDEQEMT